MADYVTLLGAEEVARASHRMSDAAAEMQRAVASLADVLDRHQQFMNDWLSRLDGTLQDRASDMHQALS